MPSSLHKVSKKISKKKGASSIKSGVLHENSRDAQKIRRASARDDKITRLAKVRAKLNQPYCRCQIPFDLIIEIVFGLWVVDKMGN